MDFHAKLSPSGADRWMVCTASVEAEDGYPDIHREEADEGTIAHELASRCLSYGSSPFSYVGEALKVKTSTGVIVGIVTEEMAEYVSWYVDNIQETIQDNDVQNHDVYIEKRVYYKKYVKDGSGTSDCILVYSDEKGNQILHVIDLKYGIGIPVSAKDNKQGMLYALGAIETFDWLYEFKDTDMVAITIHQPRIGDGEPDNFFTTVNVVKEFGKLVASVALDIERGNTKFVVTAKGCQFCRRAHNCSARADELLSLVHLHYDEDGRLSDKLPKVEDMNNLQIAELIKRSTEIVSFVNKVESTAVRKALAGEEVYPDLKLVEGRSRRQWANENEAAEVVEEVLGADKAWVENLVSPAQAEKLAGKKKSELRHLIEKPKGKATLAPLSDKRSVYVKTDDKDDFEDETKL